MSLYLKSVADTNTFLLKMQLQQDSVYRNIYNGFVLDLKKSEIFKDFTLPDFKETFVCLLPIFFLRSAALFHIFCVNMNTVAVAEKT